MTTSDLRCAPCGGRLIAKRLPSVALEVKQRGRPLAVVRDGVVYCSVCGAEVQARPEREAPTFRVVEEGG